MIELRLNASAALESPCPLLSVVVPALELDLELRRCLDSVRLCLSDPGDCEIVLVVPPRHLAEARLIENVVAIAESRPTVYGAMNDGVKASRGHFLYFLGKDDVLLPAARQALEVLRTTSPSALFCDVYWGTEGVHRGSPSRWKILFRNVCHQGIIYSRRAVIHHGPYLRRMRVQADHLLNIKLLWDAESRRRVRYLPTPLAWYSATGYSSVARDILFYRLHPAIMRRYLGRVAACIWRAYKFVHPERTS